MPKAAQKSEGTKGLNLSMPGGHIDLIKYIKLEKLQPNPYQPESRVQVDEETAGKFGLSILEHGLLQTPVARKVYDPIQIADEGYQIGDGWLRLAGYKWLVDNGHPDWNEMPVSVRDLTDQQMADLVMETNTVRKDLNPIELAGFYKRYLEDFKITQEELARRHNCSQGEIANTMRLLELPEDIQGKIISREMSESHGRQLLRLNNDTGKQKKLLKEVETRGMSVNDLSNRIQSDIYYGSKSLEVSDNYYSDRPRFDVAGCQDCEHAEKLGSPYSSDKKELRCLNPDCWKEKQKQAEQSALEEKKEELKAQGIERVYSPDELKHNDYNNLWDHFLEKHPECNSCAHRAGLTNSYSSGIDIVCIDPECYQGKVDSGRIEQDAERSREDAELEERINSAVAGVTDLAEALRIVYRLRAADDDTGEFVERMLGIDLSEVEETFDPEEDFEKKIACMDMEELVKTMLLFDLQNIAGSRWQRDSVLPILDRLEAMNSGQPSPTTKEKEIETQLNPATDEYVLNHTYRIIRKTEFRKSDEISDITAKDLPTAIEALGLSPDEIESVKVHKSSGKRGTAGYITSGWGKCTENYVPVDIAELEPKETLAHWPDAEELKKQARAEVAAESEARAEAASFSKRIKCSWCNKSFLGKFSLDKEVKDSEHWRAECPECGGINHISNEYWDGMIGAKKSKGGLPQLCSFNDCTLKSDCEHYKQGKTPKDCLAYETECTNYPSPDGGSIISWFHCKHLPLEMWPRVALEHRETAEVTE